VYGYAVLLPYDIPVDGIPNVFIKSFVEFMNTGVFTGPNGLSINIPYVTGVSVGAR